MRENLKHAFPLKKSASIFDRLPVDGFPKVLKTGTATSAAYKIGKSKSHLF